MTDKLQAEHDVKGSQPVESIVELFHMVKSLIPEGQAIVSVTPHTTVAAAVEMMQAGGFSQLPVVSGKAVLGIFSYRSLSRKLLELGRISVDYRELPVDEFIEQFTFVQSTDRWVSILDILNREDGVLVGNRDDLRGILTAMDVLTYLHRIASPFVMLAEIETSLRRIIGACVGDEGLAECAANSLAGKYTRDDVPQSLSEMTFSDYVQIIGDGRNWPRFEPAFGSGDWLRRQAVVRLTEVRDLRNDAFHFRRRLDEQDHATLMQHRDWLEMKARSFEGHLQQANAQAKAADLPAEQPEAKAERRKWTDESFFARLAASANAEVVATVRDLYEWSKDTADRVAFGTGSQSGSFTFHFLRAGNTVSVFTIYTYASVSLNYGQLRPRVTEDTMEGFHQRITAIPSFRRIPRAYGKWPTLKVAEAFSSAEEIESFKQTIHWLREQIDSDG